MLHLATFIAGVPIRAGYNRKWGFLLNRKIRDERDEGKKHETEYTMDILRLVGVQGEAPVPRLYPDPEAERKVDSLMSGRKLSSGKKMIAVHPGSSNPSKMWPHEWYAELIGKIKEAYDCDIVLLGAGEEKGLASRIKEECPERVHNLAGTMDIKELVALLSRCGLFIGNDTGPMHMAAAVGVPVIAIFGRNIPGVSPARWAPACERKMVFHEDVGCDPCYDAECPYGHKCLHAVTVDMVFDAAKKMLLN